MQGDYQAAYREAVALAKRSEVAVETIEVRHDPTGTLVYLCNYKHDITANLEDGTPVTFRAVGFNFTLPSADETGVSELVITVQNVNHEASDVMLAFADSSVPAKVVYRPYLLSDLSTPQMNPPLELFARSGSATDKAVTVRASFADLLNKPFLNRVYNRRAFPSLSL